MVTELDRMEVGERAAASLHYENRGLVSQRLAAVPRRFDSGRFLPVYRNGVPVAMAWCWGQWQVGSLP